VRRAPNDLLVQFRDKPSLVQSMVDLGIRKKTANAILDAFPEGRGLEDASLSALEHLGASPKEARQIRAAFSVVRVCDRSCEQRIEGHTVNSPTALVRLLREVLGRRPQEFFAAVLLDARQRVIDVLGVAVGSLAQVDVHPRELFAEAVRRRAHTIILVHNHPSGDATPSEADVELTKRMVDVGALVGIPVLDHLIVTPTDATSLAQIGLLPTARAMNPAVERLIAFP
jgi:DNA repair protein RadC